MMMKGTWYDNTIAAHFIGMKFSELKFRALEMIPGYPKSRKRKILKDMDIQKPHDIKCT
jgi:hypothetical protein